MKNAGPCHRKDSRSMPRRRAAIRALIGIEGRMPYGKGSAAKLVERTAGLEETGRHPREFEYDEGGTEFARQRISTRSGDSKKRRRQTGEQIARGLQLGRHRWSFGYTRRVGKPAAPIVAALWLSLDLRNRTRVLFQPAAHRLERVIASVYRFAKRLDRFGLGRHPLAS